jgi:tetratricopeptide (TPR) repeat protein
MDDVDVWYELADLYISTLNYNKAIFCLEEVLLHYPNNYEIYIKIGDLLNSFNNTESAGPALKYYSKSILLKPTPRAFWGIIQIGNIYSKFKKPLDDNLKKLIKISIINLKNSYSISMIEALTSQIKLN